MKIQSINPNINYGLFAVKNNQQNKQNQGITKTDESLMLKDLTHNISLVNFKASKTPPVNISKLPLDEKLTVMFSQLQFGEVVTVGKSLNEVQKGLKKLVDTFDGVIKKIFYIEHGGIGVPMAFSLDSFNSLKCHNLGEDDIYIATENQYSTIFPDDIWYLNEEDVIINKSQKIPVRIKVPDEKFYLNQIFYHSPELSDVYNYENILSEKLIQQNLETFEFLVKGELMDKKEEVKKGLSFADVGGLDGVITKLKKGIIYPIKFPYAYKNRNINKGFILHGPPGTGKTLLAQALANEINANYVKLNGLEMESKWVGESEENWRTLFSGAKECQPSIIFIDEFDAVARDRGGQDVHGDKVVNQLLTLMSDVEKENQQVYVIAATNKLDTIDKAVLRSGRFGEHIEVNAPDRKGLKQIFDVHTRNENIDRDFDESKFLDECAVQKFTGADIAFLVNKAHENSWERCGIYEKMEENNLFESDLLDVKLTQADFDKALDEIVKSRKQQTRKPIGYTK